MNELQSPRALASFDVDRFRILTGSGSARSSPPPDGGDGVVETWPRLWPVGLPETPPQGRAGDWLAALTASLSEMLGTLLGAVQALLGSIFGRDEAPQEGLRPPPLRRED